LRILETGAVIEGIGGFWGDFACEEGSDAALRTREIRLDGEELDEVVTEANQGPLGADLEDTPQQKSSWQLKPCR